MIVATGDRSTPGYIYIPMARLPGMVQPCRAHYIEGQHVAIIFGVFTSPKSEVYENDVASCADSPSTLQFAI